ncbi:stage III sporulation protein AE [Anaerocolumna xylanovorans]|uniref:Stage III sporulation protein AE n=1 Tax=Anaerocolumna xylanovorans DSM 12503 TaxID=1121345 RepID=A0A1M7YIW2_9FIRM|nr:stage III sporulation protein AE [Anaerocolumna xylanovorans]SHO52565.1 stage III sporulation protein AE [Anaerocolumna xylanovorans DSM 12503]
MKKTFLCMIFVLLLLAVPKVRALAASDNQLQGGEDIDFSQIQSAIDEALSADNDFDFMDYVNDLVSGKRTFSITGILDDLKLAVTNEVKNNINTFTGLISIAVIAAIFTNFSYAFQNMQVADTGFYVAYLLLFSILTGSFITASSMAADALSSLLELMKALVPSYFMAVAFCSGAGTSMVYYQITLFLITFVDVLLIKIIIPMINIYLVISMANNLSKEDVLSKLTELMETLMSWGLKTLVGVVVGFNAVQGLITPVSDKMKKSLVFKAAEAIPGVGDIFGGVAESVLGAGVLLKNAIGVAGIVVIVILCAVPIIKLAVLTLIYKVSSAAVQPISDKRMLKCISASADACMFLLQTVIVGAVLFIITIAIVAATTT